MALLTPADLTIPPTIWHRPEELGSGASVSQWDNVGTVGGNLFPQGSYPALEVDALNGYDAVRTTSGTSLQSTYSVGITGAQTRTVFLVAKKLELGTGNVLGWGVDSGGQINDLLWYGASNEWISHHHGGGYDTISGSPLPGTDWHVLEFGYTGTQVQTWMDGQARENTSMTLNTGNSVLRLGGGIYSAIDGGTHIILEFLIFPYQLSVDDAALVEGYLHHKYALAALLPSGHAHKSSAPATAEEGGLIGVRVGGAWVSKPVKVRMGSSWVEKPLKVYSGGEWVLT